MTGYLLLGASTGAVIALAIWLVVIPLGLRGIFDALGVARSRAWVPFVNIATVYRLGGLSEYWLIVLVIPPASVLGMIMLFVASHRITRQLGRSGWFTVLAVVLWWAWALALGARRERSWPARDEPVVWSVRRPEAALKLPSADDTTDSASSPLFEPVVMAPPRLATPVSEPPAMQPTVPIEPFARPVAPAPSASPGAPTPSAGRVAPASFARPVVPEPSAGRVAPEARIETPTPPTPLPPMPEPADEASVPVLPHFEPADDATILTRGSIDQTVISSRRRPRWAVHTTMGSHIELVGTSAILGRRPRPQPLYPGAQLVMVTDDATSVSASHAVLEYVDGEWQITDLGSTNGVWLVDPATGEETELGAHQRRRVTPQFLLGELGVQVVRNV